MHYGPRTKPKGKFAKLFTNDQMHAIHRDGGIGGISWTIEISVPVKGALPRMN